MKALPLKLIAGFAALAPLAAFHSEIARWLVENSQVLGSFLTYSIFGMLGTVTGAGKEKGSESKREILSHLGQASAPTRDSLVWLRERFVEYLGQNKAHPARDALFDQLVGVHRSLGGKKAQIEEAWDELQGVALELKLDLEKWLGSELDLPDFLRSEAKPQFPTETLATPRPREAESEAPAGPPAETFEARQAAILRELEQARKALDPKKSRLNAEERKDRLEDLREVERVRRFVEKEWVSLQETGRVKGGWTAHEIGKAQLGLLERIFLLRRYLEAGPTEAIAALRPLWQFRDYQERMISSFERDVADKIAPWLALASPMQTGKTSLIPHIAKVLRKHYGAGARCFILCSSKIQAEQIRGDLLEHFSPQLVGRYDSEVKDPRDITVAMVQTMVGHLHESIFAIDGRPVCLINDEAYSTQSLRFQEIYTHFGLAETVKEGRHKVLRPKQGNGLVVGLSGTGAGLEGYHLSLDSRLDFLTAMNEGWIRHMDIDRVLLKISSERKSGNGGENMIWWEATPENAEALVEVYDQKIQGQHEKVLTYVPTTEHADLLAEAMEKKYGKGHSWVIHSKMTPDKIKQALAHYEEHGGNLISVGMLSRSYRGTGTGAVFHTYQSDSIELVAQRTGRAQGIAEGEVLPDLYVLEASWSERDSFAAMAKIAGLVEAPLRRVSTREIVKAVSAIQSRKKLEAERDRKVEIGEVISLFKGVPLAEEWRALFEARLAEVGGVVEMAKRTGLPAELLAGFALGALPTALGDVMKMQEFLGGEEAASALWVDSWGAVVEGVLGGRERVAGALEKALLEWHGQKGEVAEAAQALDGILTKHFPRASVLTRADSSLFYQLARVVEGVSEAELAEIFQREVESFLEDLKRENPNRACIFQGRVLSVPPKTFRELASTMQVSWQYIRQVQMTLERRFIARVERSRRSQPADIRQAPIEHLDLSARSFHALINHNIKSIGELCSLYREDILAEWETFGRRSLGEIEDALAKLGLNLKSRKREAILSKLAEVIGKKIDDTQHIEEVFQREADLFLQELRGSNPSHAGIFQDRILSVRPRGEATQVEVVLERKFFARVMKSYALSQEAILQLHIRHLNLSKRIIEALEPYVQTIEALCALSRKELWGRRISGPKALEEIEAALAEFELKLDIKKEDVTFPRVQEIAMTASSPLLSKVAALIGKGMEEPEVGVLFEREARAFFQGLKEEKPRLAKVFHGRALSNPYKPIRQLARELSLPMWRVEHLETALENRFLAPIRKRRLLSLSPEEVLQLSVENLGLSLRAAHALSSNEIQSIAQLCAFSPKELLKKKNFGHKILKEIQEELTGLGLKLKSEEESRATGVAEALAGLALAKSMFSSRGPVIGELTEAPKSTKKQDELFKVARQAFEDLFETESTLISLAENLMKDVHSYNVHIASFWEAIADRVYQHGDSIWREEVYFAIEELTGIAADPSHILGKPPYPSLKFKEVNFYRNGVIQEATLNHSMEIEGYFFPEGSLVRFKESGWLTEEAKRMGKKI